MLTLEMLDRFRERGIDAKESITHDWMRNVSDLLEAPPAVTIYRVDEEGPPDTRA